MYTKCFQVSFVAHDVFKDHQKGGNVTNQGFTASGCDKR